MRFFKHHVAEVLPISFLFLSCAAPPPERPEKELLASCFHSLLCFDEVKSDVWPPSLLNPLDLVALLGDRFHLGLLRLGQAIGASQ